MAKSTPPPRSRQVESLQRQFAQAPGLPFAALLPADVLARLLYDHGVAGYDRLYPPLVTLAMMLSQCHDADPSLRQAVARRLAQRVALGQRPGSANTSAYSRARHRLPAGVIADLARYVGGELQCAAPARWRWLGRAVKVVDGTTISLPDTPANQKAYPQMKAQKPGLGFPILRCLVVFALAVGSVLDAAFGPYHGKETSELALFRQLYGHLDAGDVVLGDRHFCSFFAIAELRRRGVDVVLRLHQRRRADFRRGARLGRLDHVVAWPKPPRPDWMDEADYAQYPASLVVRETRMLVVGRGVRTRSITLATTLLDPARCGKADLAQLYRLRWQAELHLRSLKTVLQMDVLRGKTPAMAGRELWAHLLAYNLIRQVMARAAEARGGVPWKISFKGALQTLKAFALPLLTCPRSRVDAVIAELLRAVGSHRVGKRPGRVEPRAVKRRAKPYDLLNRTRAEARKRETSRRCA